MLELARLAQTCCDKPEDRMYHANDGTWWRRDGTRWVSADPPTGDHADNAADANRFRWLIKQGVAWRDCYRGDWQTGEWLYESQSARDFVDEAMKQDQIFSARNQ